MGHWKMLIDGVISIRISLFKISLFKGQGGGREGACSRVQYGIPFRAHCCGSVHYCVWHSNLKHHGSAEEKNHHRTSTEIAPSPPPQSLFVTHEK